MKNIRVKNAIFSRIEALRFKDESVQDVLARMLIAFAEHPYPSHAAQRRERALRMAGLKDEQCCYDCLMRHARAVELVPVDYALYCSTHMENVNLDEVRECFKLLGLPEVQPACPSCGDPGNFTDKHVLFDKVWVALYEVRARQQQSEQQGQDAASQ